jgi:hypothetical protein
MMLAVPEEQYFSMREELSNLLAGVASRFILAKCGVILNRDDLVDMPISLDETASLLLGLGGGIIPYAPGETITADGDIVVGELGSGGHLVEPGAIATLVAIGG